MPIESQARILQGLDALKLTVNDKQLNQFESYLGLLQKWNKAYNLTSVRQPEQMLPVHLLDSLSIASHLKGESFLDVGTGPGLPGIPLAILFPEKMFTLLDSNGKKVRFLFQVINSLGLKNVRETQRRVEDFTSDKLFDAVLSRAFASLEDMLLNCRHTLDSKGHFYAMKGKYPATELSDLPKGFKVNAVTEISVPGLDGERHLVDLSFLEENT